MSRPVGLGETLRGVRKTLTRLQPYVREERSLVRGGLAAMMLGVVFRLLEPWPLKFVIDRVLVPSPGASGAAVDADAAVRLLALCAGGVLLIALFRAAVDYWSKIGFALAGNRVLTKVRSDLYSHLQKLSFDFHSSSRGGDLTIRVISDVGLVREVAVTALLPMMGNFVVLVAMAGVMIWFDPRLAGIAALTLPLLLLRASSLNRRIHQVSKEQRRREGALAATAAESVAAIRTVRALSLEKRFEAEFDRHAAKDLKEGVRGKRLSAHLERSVDLAIAGSTALVLWFGARLVLGGTMTPGALIVFLTYLKRAFKPVRDMAKYSGRLAKAAAASDRIFDVLDQIPEVRDRPGARILEEVRGAVSLDGVSVDYGRTHALVDVSLSIAPRSLVAIVGPSGGGKTTLAGLFARFRDPDAGVVRLDGVDVREYTLNSLRGRVGIVLQEGVLFAGTAFENVAVADPTAPRERVIEAARIAGAKGFIERLPEGFETEIGERGARLSGGERQRIALARVLLRDPSILILDEPTTGLDVGSREKVAAAIRAIAEDRTVLLITHDLDLARIADRVLVLERGRLIRTGGTESMVGGGGVHTRRHRTGVIHARSA